MILKKEYLSISIKKIVNIVILLLNKYKLSI